MDARGNKLMQNYGQYHEKTKIKKNHQTFGTLKVTKKRK